MVSFQRTRGRSTARDPEVCGGVAHLAAEVALRRGDMREALSQCDRAFAALAQLQGGKVKAQSQPRNLCGTIRV